MLNALTIDVEDYFQVNAFAKVIDKADWDHYPLRVGGNTNRILDLLDEFRVKATFFVLGWVAHKDPGLVRRIVAGGHELACHGYGHELIHVIGPVAFREDLRRSKNLLEDVSGVQVSGYRAPSYSIVRESLWALDILIEEGFSYDSSIFPIHHDTYGIPDFPRFPHRIRCPSGTILEFPLTTLNLRVLGREQRVPVAGGGYLRLFPARFIRFALRRINRLEHKPVALYFHPWEIDPDQPRIAAGFRSRFRHYLNLDRTEARLRVLLQALQFAPMGLVLSTMDLPTLSV